MITEQTLRDMEERAERTFKHDASVICELVAEVRRLRAQVEAGVSREIAAGREKDELRRQRDAAVAERDLARQDIVRAAGEMLININDAPPGSLPARLMAVNALMRHERDDARQSEVMLKMAYDELRCDHDATLGHARAYRQDAENWRAEAELKGAALKGVSATCDQLAADLATEKANYAACLRDYLLMREDKLKAESILHTAIKPLMPKEWAQEEAKTCFARSYQGEGSYYCPRCDANRGTVYMESNWRPTKAEALCEHCRTTYSESPA